MFWRAIEGVGGAGVVVTAILASGCTEPLPLLACVGIEAWFGALAYVGHGMGEREG